MIYLYSGTPGSGKSLHVAHDIVSKLSRGQRVIANFPINEKLISRNFLGNLLKKDGKYFNKKIGDFVYKDNSDLTVDFLVRYAQTHHRKGKEGQTLLVIDECSVLFNPREYMKSDRLKWIKFFQMHRHLGYNVILISQTDRLIDRQIRTFIEYDVKHRKANNYGSIGFIFTVLRLPLFIAVTYWYGVREKCGVDFFTYRKKYSRIYDSFVAFDKQEIILG